MLPSLLGLLQETLKAAGAAVVAALDSEPPT